MQYLKEYSDSLFDASEEKIISKTKEKKDKHQGPQGPRPKVIVLYNCQECELKLQKSRDRKVTIVINGQTVDVCPSELEILKIE